MAIMTRDSTRADVNAAGSGEVGGNELADTRSELEASREALADSVEARAFLESVLNASNDCIKVLTMTGEIIFMNKGGQRVMEVDDFETIRGCPWVGFWEGQGHIEATSALSAAKAGSTGHFRGAAPTAKGTMKHWDVTVTRIAAGANGSSHILSISRDITDEKKLEEQRELLSRELSHRVKNSLSIAQAIASQTFCKTEGTRLREFSGRLAALGTAQDLLLQSSWQRAPIRTIVDAALSTLSPEGSYHIEGPDHELAPRQGLSLALALHELGTNALKFGALSAPDGMVRVSWTTSNGELRLNWSESGGPPVTPPERTGFGTRLITRNLESDFKGKVVLNYSPTGVVLTLSAPL